MCLVFIMRKCSHWDSVLAGKKNKKKTIISTRKASAQRYNAPHVL